MSGETGLSVILDRPDRGKMNVKRPKKRRSQESRRGKIIDR